MKRKYHLIKYEQLPEGIQLCLNNCIRYSNESKILEEKKLLQSSMVSILLATEEFSKCKMLFDYYVKQKDVPVDKVKDIFSSHKIRLKEFHKAFMSSLPKQIFSQDRLDRFSQSIGETEQMGKMNLMYVDWVGFKWHNPITSSGFVEENLKDVPYRLGTRIKSMRMTLLGLIKQFIENEKFIEIQNAQKIDNPTNSKIIKIIQDFYGKVPISLEFTYDYRLIDIKIKSTTSKITPKNNQMLREKIFSQYPDYIIKIKIDHSI